MGPAVLQTPQHEGTGLIKKMSVNRESKIKGTIRMLTPAELRGQDCTFLFENVHASEREKEFISIGMTMRFFYGGNEVTGYRASWLELMDIAEYTAVVTRVPVDSTDVNIDEGVSSSVNLDDESKWTGLQVTLDLTLEPACVSAASLRELFTNPDTGEVEPCSIKPGDRCLVRILTKDWLQANRDDKKVVFTIVSFLPSDSIATLRHRGRALSATENDAPTKNRTELVDLINDKGKEKTVDPSAPNIDTPASPNESVNPPPSDLSPQHKPQSDVRQTTRTDSELGAESWKASKPLRARAWSSGQLENRLDPHRSGAKPHSMQGDHRCRCSSSACPRARRSWCPELYTGDMFDRHTEQSAVSPYQMPPVSPYDPVAVGRHEASCLCTSCDCGQICRQRCCVTDPRSAHVQPTCSRGFYRPSWHDGVLDGFNMRENVAAPSPLPPSVPPFMGVNQCCFGPSSYTHMRMPPATTTDPIEAQLATAADQRPINDMQQPCAFSAGYRSMPINSLTPQDHLANYAKNTIASQSNAAKRED